VRPRIRRQATTDELDNRVVFSVRGRKSPFFPQLFGEFSRLLCCMRKPAHCDLSNDIFKFDTPVEYLDELSLSIASALHAQ
jgi:hypothetical protein